MRLQRAHSWILSVAPAATWTIAVILGCEALWIAQTFRSSSLLLPLALFFIIIVSLRVWFTSADATSNKPAKQVSYAFGKLLGSWLLMLFCATSLAGVVSIERIAIYSESSVNYLSMIADIVAHAAWLCTALMLVVWPRTGHPMMLPMGVVIGLVTIAAGGASQTLNSQTAAAIAFCIVFVTGSQTVGAAHAWLSMATDSDTTLGSTKKLVANENRVSIGGTQQRHIRHGESTLGLKWLMSLAVLSVILTMTSTLARATQEVLPSVQNLLQRGLKDTLESVAIRSPIGSGLYVDGSTFGNVRESLTDPQGVALRVYADSTPGYLRGSVFDVFTERRWVTIETIEQYQQTRFTSDSYNRSIKPSDIRASQPKGPSTKRLRHFDVLSRPFIDEADKTIAAPQVQTVEVHNDPRRGSLVFTPLSVAWIEASTRQLQLSAHSSVIGAGIDFEQPYIAGASDRPEKELLSDGMREVLLKVPEEIAVVADTIVETELGLAGADGARQKAERIREYFQQNFTYTLDRVNRPRKSDPIVYFLESKHPAHCEYFATASSMLLRRAGVPTRYVTGYVADEDSGEDDYWIARNSDAHAWVEAYDDLSQTWFPVESTPGRSYQTVTFAAQSGGSVDGSSQEADSGIKERRSLLATLASWWALLQSNDPLLTVYRYLQIPLLVVLCTLIWLRRRSIHHAEFDPIDVQSYKLLARTDRRLRKHGLVRTPRETLHQFADRIELNAFEKREIATPAEFANWYRNYGNARYQGQVPVPFELAN